MTENLKQKFQCLLGTDLDGALQELGIPVEAYERVLRIAVLSTEEGLPLLEGAVAVLDFDEIQKKAHEFKGVYSNLRLERLAGPCRRMSALARAVIAEGMEDELRMFREEFRVLKEIMA